MDTSMDLKVFCLALTICHRLNNDIFERGSTLEAPLQDPFRASVPRKKIFARRAPNPGANGN